MAYTLKLKRRAGRDALQIPLQALKNMLANGRDTLLADLERIAKDDQVHDKAWLETIVNWTPEGGMPLTEMSKWMKLAQRVSSLDDGREGDFTLSQWHVDLIWSRLTDARYKVIRMSPPFVEFLIGFQEATGKRFENQEPGDSEQ